jgi:hypothetical protein
MNAKSTRAIDALRPLSEDEEKIVAGCRDRGEIRYAPHDIRRYRGFRPILDVNAMDPGEADRRKAMKPLAPVEPFEFRDGDPQPLERY